eukprot:808234-Rhodomonas_salina.3
MLHCSSFAVPRDRTWHPWIALTNSQSRSVAVDPCPTIVMPSEYFQDDENASFAFLEATSCSV